ncbi:MAG: glycosyltransferase family 39 protein [Chloroflexi bacterium]|nr:glycosyltransferase family 39 protein [Chloroflexota bacterium]
MSGLKKALLLVLLGSFAVRGFRLGTQSLWFDEGYSLHLAGLDWLSLVRVTATDIHPPLYYALLKVWVWLVGNTEFALRYLSLLFGVLMVPANYALASRLFGRRIAGVAAVLAAFSPLYVYYSQELRMYTLLGLSSLLALYFFTKALATQQKKYWVAYVLFMTAALYSHLYAALVFVVLCLALIGFSLPNRRGERRAQRAPAPTIKTPLAGPRSGLLSQVAVVLLFLPWAPTALDKVANYSSPAGGSGVGWILEQVAIVFSLGHSVLGITTFPGHPSYEADRSLALLLSLPLLALVVLGAIAMLAGGRRAVATVFASSRALRRRALFAVVLLALPVCLIALLSLGKRDFNARYLFPIVPAYYLLAAIGLVVLLSRGRLRILAGVASLVLIGIWGYSLHNYYFSEKYSRDDHRSAVEYIRRNALPGDLVVLDANFDSVYRYYARDELPWVRFPEFFPPDNKATEAALARTVPDFQRVWLVMWGDYYVDPDRVVQRWLDSHSFRLDGRSFHGPITVYGYLASSPVLEGMPQPQNRVTADFAGQLSLVGYDRQIEEAPANRRIHLTLYWQAEQTMAVNYSIFAHVLNAAGQMVGLGDSQPVNGYLPTTVWQPGQIVRSGLDVWLRPGTPPGDYRVAVGVYDQGTMRRLDTAKGNSVDLGSVRLSERTLSARTLDFGKKVIIPYGDAIQLVGYTIGQPAGDSLHLTLFWRAQRRPDRRYTVFNHLVDASGKIAGQKDGEPAGGAYWTDRWTPGEVVRDEYDIPLSDSLSGEYRLLTGLYAPDTGVRLPIKSWWPFGKRDTAYELGKVSITGRR